VTSLILASTKRNQTETSGVFREAFKKSNIGWKEPELVSDDFMFTLADNAEIQVLAN
jgi:hypothetical protein